MPFLFSIVDQFLFNQNYSVNFRPRPQFTNISARHSTSLKIQWARSTRRNGIGRGPRCARKRSTVKKTTRPLAITNPHTRFIYSYGSGKWEIRRPSFHDQHAAFCFIFSHIASYLQNGDHSRKKHKHRSPHSDEDVPQQQHRRQQSGSPSPETRRRPPPSSLSPENRRGGSGGDGGGGGGRRGRDDASAAGGREETRQRDEGWGRKSDSRDKGGERRRGGGEGGAGASGGKKDEPAPEKEKANLGLSGKLTEDTNTFRGVVIKYNEPPEARKPKVKWRLYQFKGEEALPTLFVHRQSAYLIGI